MKITGVIKYFYSVYVLGSLFLTLIRRVPIYLYSSFTAFHLAPATFEAFLLLLGQLFCYLFEEACDLCCPTMSQLFPLHNHF